MSIENTEGKQKPSKPRVTNQDRLITWYTDQQTTGATPEEIFARLAPRQKQIAKRMVAGSTYQRIGVELEVDPNYVRQQGTVIYKAVTRSDQQQEHTEVPENLAEKPKKKAPFHQKRKWIIALLDSFDGETREERSKLLTDREQSITNLLTDRGPGAKQQKAIGEIMGLPIEKIQSAEATILSKLLNPERKTMRDVVKTAISQGITYEKLFEDLSPAERLYTEAYIGNDSTPPLTAPEVAEKFGKSPMSIKPIISTARQKVIIAALLPPEIKTVADGITIEFEERTKPERKKANTIDEVMNGLLTTQAELAITLLVHEGHTLDDIITRLTDKQALMIRALYQPEVDTELSNQELAARIGIARNNITSKLRILIRDLTGRDPSDIRDLMEKALEVKIEPTPSEPDQDSQEQIVVFADASTTLAEGQGAASMREEKREPQALKARDELTEEELTFLKNNIVAPSESAKSSTEAYRKTLADMHQSLTDRLAEGESLADLLQAVTPRQAEGIIAILSTTEEFTSLKHLGSIIQVKSKNVSKFFASMIKTLSMSAEQRKKKKKRTTRRVQRRPQTERTERRTRSTKSTTGATEQITFVRPVFERREPTTISEVVEECFQTTRRTVRTFMDEQKRLPTQEELAELIPPQAENPTLTNTLGAIWLKGLEQANPEETRRGMSLFDLYDQHRGAINNVFSDQEITHEAGLLETEINVLWHIHHNQTTINEIAESNKVSAGIIRGIYIRSLAKLESLTTV